MPSFRTNHQGRVVAVADTLPTQDEMQRLAHRISGSVHVFDGRDTGLSAEPAPTRPSGLKTMHLSGLIPSGTTAMLRVEDLSLDPQAEIIGLLASLPERDRRLLAGELPHRLVP